MMFCFNQWNKRNCIGNLQLAPDEYQQIKAKLLGEVREELKKSKSFPSLLKLIPNRPLGSDVKISVAPGKREESIAPIEKAFISTFKVIFKKDVSSMKEYENWLSKRIVPTRELTSVFGSKVYVPDHHPTFWMLSAVPDKRMVTYDEAAELGRFHIDEAIVGDLDKLKEWTSNTACYPTEFIAGRHKNLIETPISLDSSNQFKVYTAIRADYCGVSSWSIQSKYVFGCHWVTDTQYSIKCYNSLGLMRCFEVDTSTRCTDSMFCHNCEGLAEAMFCWNTKGKRYAIGNTQLQPEQYREIKDMLVAQIADEVVAKKDFKWDIFNVGCWRK